MSSNKRMYLLWLTICSTMAKHLPITETDLADHQRYPSSDLETSSSSSQPSNNLYSAEYYSSIDTLQQSHSSTNPPLFDSGGSEWRESSNDITNVTQNNETNLSEANAEEMSANGSRINRIELSAEIDEDSNSIQKTLTDLEQKVIVNDTRSLKRVFLSNRAIVCNDGSQAGFYLRKSLSFSRVWVVFLEGGWYCYDRQSCRNRWLRMRHLMTSNQWPDSRDVSGILSPRPSENPHWHTANHVSVPYCSSDSWSGTAALRNNTSFHFMGKHILNQVIRDLIPLGLQNSSQLILAGSSAGGTGVMVNLDPIQHLLHAELGLKHIAVRGISDSGWFLDRTPYSPNTLPAVDAIKKGHALWQGSLPKRCVDLYPQEPWRCYFGYRLYPTIRAPLFVFQWLFDEAQMTADNVGTPVTPQQWDYIHSMGRALRASFANVSAVFAPSCVSHSVLTKKDWLQVTVADVTVANALRCWELATMKRPFRNHSKLANVTPRGLAVRQLVRSATQDETIEGGGGARRRRPSDGGPRRRRRKKNREGHHDDRNYRDRNIFNNDHSFNQRPRKQHKTPNQRKTMSNSHRMSNYHYSQTDNNRRKHGNRRRGNVVHNCSNEEEIQYNQRPEPNTRRNQLNCDSKHKGRRHNRSRKEDKRHRNVNATLVPNIISIVGEDKSGYGRSRNEELDGLEKPIRPQRSLLRGPKTVNPGCEHRHIEPCSWPQCNPSCPRLLNPNTGEEVLFVDMLKSFGLEMESVARALGVDMHTLNNMDQSELLNLLTQQIN